MNQASPNTVANLRRDPRLEVNVVDFLKRRGYRFKGTAEIRPPGDEVYEWVHRWLFDIHGPGYPAIGAVLVDVERVLPVDSPAYAFGHAMEEGLVSSWAASYGVTASGEQAGAPS